MNGLGITEVVDHYDSIIRGLGAAAVAISPAQIKGVLRLPPAQIRTVWPALRNPANSKKTVPLTPKQFHFRFTNTMNDADARAAYDRYYVPGPGRVLFQAGFANFNPRAVTKVDVHKDDRAPLLVLGNEKDHTVPASVSGEAATRLGKSKAVVEYKEFAGRRGADVRRVAGEAGWPQNQVVFRRRPEHKSTGDAHRSSVAVVQHFENRGEKS